MMDTYGGAEKVIVWLGEDYGFALEAISLIRKLAGIAQREGTEWESKNSLRDVYHPREDIPRLDDES
jgi:hypothetical protein